MEQSDIFFLKWNEFTDNMTDTLRSLRGDNDFTDVTLVCEDGLVLEAHKVILAASSPFFLDVLKLTKQHPHPLIYLKGVKMRELAFVVEFLYSGEVNLNQEKFDSFFILAAFSFLHFHQHPSISNPSAFIHFYPGEFNQEELDSFLALAAAFIHFHLFSSISSSLFHFHQHPSISNPSDFIHFFSR